MKFVVKKTNKKNLNMKKLQNSFYEIKIAYSPICNNSNIINTFLQTQAIYTVVITSI